MHPLHYYIVADPFGKIMFQSENLQPFSPSLMSYMPNCNVRYPPHPAHRNPHAGMYRSLSHHQLNENPQCSSSSFNQKYHTGISNNVCQRDQSQPSPLFSCRSIPQSNVCTTKYEDEVFQSGGDEHERRHCEKFNELNHPLMAIDCRKNTEIRSLSPTDSGISSQSSTPGHFQKGSCLIRGSNGGSGCSSSVDSNEPRGTKRHYQNNRTSRSPSPLLNPSSAKPSGAEPVASRPKRRFQDCCEGLPPIVPSACLLNIQLRSHRPDSLLNGSEWDRLSHAIWCKYTSHEQTQETLRRKLRLREMVHHYIRSYYLHQCGLYIVGSSVSGFGGESSDMDLCLVISGHDVDQRFHALEYLYRVQKALKQCRFLTKLDVIRAKVPILRFFDSITNLEVDLNFNNIVGIRNTHLLKTYAQLDWRVRPLVLAVKLWARQHDINEAKSMTMSSYSLTLMVIYYLQAGVHVPVLPCLQKVRAERFWPEGDIRRLQTFTDDELKVLRSNNHMTLGQLFAGFLDYYAHHFNYGAHAMSIRLGGTIPLEQCRQYMSSKNDPHHWKYICIEEPFDRTNTARSVYDPAAFQKIVDVFRQSAAKISQTKDLSSVMT
ncbi:poly(A) RNA polymerase GLD2-like isoform X3 [Daphnia carinata]|uniref:poly(A) RNA polymerase GLD2-like isoform X3 n=1 Tax=Daphnia carinata TaxID=120202 RepID=UPI002868DEFD|nr:poly(A) RNA polymerase GLD2-like isoform X3 [Daphnia carinata]